MNSDLLQKLKHIESRDPDGGEQEPTEVMHNAHKMWAILKYGPDVWARYCEGGWDDPQF